MHLLSSSYNNGLFQFEKKSIPQPEGIKKPPPPLWTIEIINNTRVKFGNVLLGANQRKSIVFLQKRPLNYDINNENTTTFVNAYLQNKNTMKTMQVFGTAPCVKYL